MSTNERTQQTSQTNGQSDMSVCPFRWNLTVSEPTDHRALVYPKIQMSIGIHRDRSTKGERRRREGSQVRITLSSNDSKFYFASKVHVSFPLIPVYPSTMRGFMATRWAHVLQTSRELSTPPTGGCLSPNTFDTPTPSPMHWRSSYAYIFDSVYAILTYRRLLPKLL